MYWYKFQLNTFRQQLTGIILCFVRGGGKQNEFSDCGSVFGTDFIWGFGI